MIKSIVHAMVQMPATVLIAMVRLYQICISPLYPPLCRFRPTCSVYFIQSVRKHGAVWGTLKGLWRICRCNPFSSGGHDPP